MKHNKLSAIPNLKYPFLVLTAIILIAALYFAGESMGEFIYKLTH